MNLFKIGFRVLYKGKVFVTSFARSLRGFIHTPQHRLAVPTGRQVSGFTLFELIISVGVIAILSGLVYITVQPADLLARARDMQRVDDLNTISTLIAGKKTQEKRVRSLGEPNILYISLPSTYSDCSDISSQLLSLPTGYSYHCVTSENLKKTDGTGWIPVDFTSNRISVLPIDPVNSITKGLYYVYTYNGTNFELNAFIESSRVQEGFAAKDGGTSSSTYEAGSLLTLYDESTMATKLADGSSCTAGSECTNGSCITLYTDADHDGYGTGSSLGGFCYTTSTIPTGKSLSSADCNDASISIYQYLNGYTDADTDGYTVGSVQQVCSGSSLPTGYRTEASAVADCYDSSSSAYPGQTSYFLQNRGDGSFDYNCDNSITKYLTSGTYNKGSNVVWTDSYYNGTCFQHRGFYSTFTSTSLAGLSCGETGQDIEQISSFSDEFGVTYTQGTSCSVLYPGPFAQLGYAYQQVCR